MVATPFSYLIAGIDFDTRCGPIIVEFPIAPEFEDGAVLVGFQDNLRFACSWYEGERVPSPGGSPLPAAAADIDSAILLNIIAPSDVPTSSTAGTNH
jgi:hypothetical protein